MVAKHARPSSSRPTRAFVVVVAVVIIGLVTWSTLGGHRHASASPSTSSTPATIATTTTTTLAPTTFSLSAVGDTDLGYTPTLPSNPVAYFAPVRTALHADVEFANLEGTMTTASSSKCGAHSTDCYAFKVPPSFAQVYRSVGFSILNSANNHSYDYGAAGEAQTSAALRAAGIVQAGLPGQIGLLTVRGVRVAFVDVAPYGLTNDMLEPAQVAQLLAQARREAHVVVAYMHSGAEGASADHVTRQYEMYYGENRGNPYEFAHFAIDHGADLVLASGPHVLRGMQWYRGHLIAYSLGDFTNYEAFSSSGALSLSAILHVTLSAHGSFVRGWVDAVRILSGGQAVLDPTHASWSFMNELSRADFGASAALIGPTGMLTP